MIKLSVLVAFAFLMVLALVDSKKNENWEELESILEDIDETKKQKQVQPQTEPNPCDNHLCGWGKECAVDKKNRPICQCVSKCQEFESESNDQVCGSNNQTYASLCQLYRQRCVCKKRSGFESECENPTNSKIHLEYLGACKNLEECTEELMAQFPERMSDWLFQVMKELKKRRELHNMEWEQLVAEAENDDEKKHVYPVIWKFCDLDIKPHDKQVSHHELIPITAPVIPMESCIKPFLERCDSNNDGSISIKEWGICLGLKEGEIQERC